MTPEQLHVCMPYSSRFNCNRFAQPITDAMAEFGIDTLERKAFFLAQIAHESMSLACVAEIASGSAYEGRRDLGNTEVGDGIKYKGHGLIQTTGRANHMRVSERLNVPFDEIVEWLQTPVGAARSAGMFWQDHDLNHTADTNDLRGNTRIINGGYNGLAERDRRLAEARVGLRSFVDFSDVVGGVV